MKRRRFLPIVALLMLLPSLFCTETAEVWCRAVVGATMDADDDDGSYFSCRQVIDTAQTGQHIRVKQTSVSAASPNGSIVDEPTYSLPHFACAVLPHISLRATVATQTVAYAAETRGSPVERVFFVRPPPRAPPVS